MEYFGDGDAAYPWLRFDTDYGLIHRLRPIHWSKGIKIQTHSTRTNFGSRRTIPCQLEFGFERCLVCDWEIENRPKSGVDLRANAFLWVTEKIFEDYSPPMIWRMPQTACFRRFQSFIQHGKRDTLPSDPDTTLYEVERVIPFSDHPVLANLKATYHFEVKATDQPELGFHVPPMDDYLRDLATDSFIRRFMWMGKPKDDSSELL